MTGSRDGWRPAAFGLAAAEALATAGAMSAIADQDADRAREAARRINRTFAQKRHSGCLNKGGAKASPSSC